MFYSFKRFFLLSTTLSLSVILHADEIAMPTQQGHKTKLQEPIKKVSYLDGNASARPCATNGHGVFFTGAALVWKAGENGLPVATIEQGTVVGELSNSVQTNLTWNWNWGFRIGMGYNTPYDGWDIYLNWTRLYSRAGVPTTFAQSNERVYPVWLYERNDLASPTNATVSRFNADWYGRLNVLDLTLGRDFLTSKRLSLRPSFGVRNAWIRQAFDINYNFASVALPPPNIVRVRHSNRFWGIGVVLGLDAGWMFDYGLSIYANGAVSLVSGLFKISLRQNTTESTAAILPTVSSDSYRFMGAITDMQVGLRWTWTSPEKRYCCMLQFGWEQHVFFGQNQMVHYAGSFPVGTYFSNQGDLYYQGWTLGMKLEF